MMKRQALHYIIGISFLLSACEKKEGYSQGSVRQPPAGTEKKYPALGDSYTIGQNVEVKDRFPVQTQAWLQQAGIAMPEPLIIATTGWTTANLLTAITSKNPTGPYDIVSLLIGVNDQYQGVDTASYRVRFTQLLEKSVSLANRLATHVFVISIPDYSVTPFAANSDTARIRREIDGFNRINKQVTLDFHAQYVDITPSTREAKGNRSLLASDGLHPSGIEYKKWADLLGPLMKPLLP